MGSRFRTVASVLIWLAAVLACGAQACAEDSWEATISDEAAALAPSGPASPTSNPSSPADALKGTIAVDPIETGAVQPKPASAIADAAALEGDQYRTSFKLGLSKGVTAEVFTLANPYRVVVDLPDVAFSLSEAAGREGRGLVRAFRYGLFAEGKARVVLDVSGPVKVEKAGMTAGADGRRVELKIDIVPMPTESFGAGTGAQRQAPSPQKASHDDDVAPDQKKSTKPVILIDPGHGGVDPGAVGEAGLLEKNVALGVALELRRSLIAAGRYEVRMTRTSDVFVSLDRRLKITRQSGADLFISLHADSIEEKAAANAIRGATVYTLSDRASDEQARQMAEKENASDLIAGIDAADSSGADQVKSILIDLMKRETANFSAEFSNVLVGKLGKAIPLAKVPHRSAAFKVLKQTYAPAVLVELGYMSNPEDQKLLNSPGWRLRVAEQVRAAVDAHFAKQTARARQ